MIALLQSEPDFTGWLFLLFFLFPLIVRILNAVLKGLGVVREEQPDSRRGERPGRARARRSATPDAGPGESEPRRSIEDVGEDLWRQLLEGARETKAQVESPPAPPKPAPPARPIRSAKPASAEPAALAREGHLSGEGSGLAPAGSLGGPRESQVRQPGDALGNLRSTPGLEAASPAGAELGGMRASPTSSDNGRRMLRRRSTLETKPRRAALRLPGDRASWRQAIVWSEILGRPVSLRSGDGSPPPPAAF